MNEGAPKNPAIPEGIEELADYLARHPVVENPMRESAPLVSELEGVIAQFEINHPLAQLHAITVINPDEPELHPVREPARIALIPITERLAELRNETNISEGTYEQLRMKYKLVSRAVGMVQKNGKVFHDR